MRTVDGIVTPPATLVSVKVLMIGLDVKLVVVSAASVIAISVRGEAVLFG